MHMAKLKGFSADQDALLVIKLFQLFSGLQATPVFLCIGMLIGSCVKLTPYESHDEREPSARRAVNSTA